jgi:hypothetical protein
MLLLSGLIFLQNQKSKLNKTKTSVPIIKHIPHIVFQKTIWSIQPGIFFNYDSFPSRLILLLNDFPLTPKVLNNDVNTIFCIHPALILYPSCIPEKVGINQKRYFHQKCNGFA